MFKKWGADMENPKTGNNGNNGKEQAAPANTVVTGNNINKIVTEKVSNGRSINTILKGSKLIGNINVTCDLELSGDVEGDIISEKNSNIAIKGTCKGNIETREGNVDIDGVLQGGDITAGNNVTISGKFNGGEVRAKGRIYINGEFDGRLEGNEIEIGSNATGKGELLYREYISIAKGAKVDVQISKAQQELKVLKTPPGQKQKVVDIATPNKAMSKAE